MKSKLLIGSILLQFVFLITSYTFAAELQRPYLAERHQSRGVTCESCHGKATPNGDQVLIGKNCVQCHGSYQKAVERTKDKYPEVNPHDQHDGDLSCVVCHKGHQKGVNYCEECHGTFVFEVP